LRDRRQPKRRRHEARGIIPSTTNLPITLTKKILLAASTGGGPSQLLRLPLSLKNPKKEKEETLQIKNTEIALSPQIDKLSETRNNRIVFNEDKVIKLNEVLLDIF